MLMFNPEKTFRSVQKYGLIEKGSSNKPVKTKPRIYRQSLIKKPARLLLCFNKSSPLRKSNLNKSKSSQFILRGNEVAMQHSLN